MAASQQLHLGTNLRNHQVWAPYKHFQRLLKMRGIEADEELLDVLDFFSVILTRRYSWTVTQ